MWSWCIYAVILLHLNCFLSVLVFVCLFGFSIKLFLRSLQAVVDEFYFLKTTVLQEFVEFIEVSGLLKFLTLCGLFVF